MFEINPRIISRSVVYRAGESTFAYNGWPSVCIDENGALYAVCSFGRIAHVCPFGKTALFISRDGGKTWSEPFIINDTVLDDRDAGIVYLGGGKMLVTWFCHPAEMYETTFYNWMKEDSTDEEFSLITEKLNSYSAIPESEKLGGSFIRISEDYGKTWGETVRVPISSPHGPNVLKDGSLIYLGKEMYSQNCEIPEKNEYIAAYKSVDNGNSWERVGELHKPENTRWSNFHEPHIVELPDGRLLGAIRGEGREVPNGFTIYFTHSDDGGKTWSDWQNNGICGSPPHLLLHSSGAVICSYGRRSEPYGERAAISRDNGETWTEEYIFDFARDDDLGYPACVELADGSILSVYYQKFGNDEKCSILCTNWKL